MVVRGTLSGDMENRPILRVEACQSPASLPDQIRLWSDFRNQIRWDPCIQYSWYSHCDYEVQLYMVKIGQDLLDIQYIFIDGFSENVACVCRGNRQFDLFRRHMCISTAVL